MRINKLFSNLGICSRKETNKLIEEKRITVNGELAVPGQWIDENDHILFDNREIKEKSKVYLAFYKPKGIVCTNSKNVNNNIIEYINYKQYIFPIGRLDKESEGLIILTNDGEAANLLLNCDNYHEKEYIVRLNKEYDDDFIYKMQNGVKIKTKSASGVKRISDTVGIRKICDESGKVLIKKELLSNINNVKTNYALTRKCKVYRIDKDTFGIVLTQGMNRQIRKMCRALGYEVVLLKRIRILNINIHNLKCGNYRNLTSSEVEMLKDKLI